MNPISLKYRKKPGSNIYLVSSHLETTSVYDNSNENWISGWGNDVKKALVVSCPPKEIHVPGFSWNLAAISTFEYVCTSQHYFRLAVFILICALHFCYIEGWIISGKANKRTCNMTLFSGGSKGGAGDVPPPGNRIFFNFMQFSGNFNKILSWRPPWGLAPPPRGNPGSATAIWVSIFL